VVVVVITVLVVVAVLVVPVEVTTSCGLCTSKVQMPAVSEQCPGWHIHVLLTQTVGPRDESQRPA